MNGELSKDEAAEYLGIQSKDLLSHVRESRLSPADPAASDWKFSIADLDSLYESYFRRYQRVRRKWSWRFLVIAGVGVSASLLVARLQPQLPILVAQYAFAFFAGFFGLAFRAHRLTRQALSSPYPDYVLDYPAILLINAAAICIAAQAFSIDLPQSQFWLFALPLASVMAMFVHPSHWLIPRWLRGD